MTFTRFKDWCMAVTLAVFTLVGTGSELWAPLIVRNAVRDYLGLALVVWMFVLIAVVRRLYRLLYPAQHPRPR